MGVEQGDAAVAEHAAVNAVEAGDLGVLVGDQPGPIVVRRRSVPAEAFGVGGEAAVFGGLDHDLLGHAADVDAGAAPMGVFGDGDAGTVAGGDAGAADAAGAATDDEEVEVAQAQVPPMAGSLKRAVRCNNAGLLPDGWLTPPRGGSARSRAGDRLEA